MCYEWERFSVDYFKARKSLSVFRDSREYLLCRPTKITCCTGVVHYEFCACFEFTGAQRFCIMLLADFPLAFSTAPISASKTWSSICYHFSQPFLTKRPASVPAHRNENHKAMGDVIRWGLMDDQDCQEIFHIKFLKYRNDVRFIYQNIGSVLLYTCTIATGQLPGGVGGWILHLIENFVCFVCLFESHVPWCMYFNWKIQGLNPGKFAQGVHMLYS